MPPRHYARSGIGENTGLPNLEWSRNCRATPREEPVVTGATGSLEVRLPRPAVRGEDRVRAKDSGRKYAHPLVVGAGALSRPAKFGGSGTWVGISLHGRGPDDLARDFLVSAGAQA